MGHYPGGAGGAPMIREVLDDMHSCGIVPTDPGVIQFDLPEMTRFHVAGDKRGTLNGYWRGFSDGLPAGVFGSWKTGQSHNWTSGDHTKWSDSDKAAFTARIEGIQRQRAEETAQAQGEVSKAAAERYMALPDASPDHGYRPRRPCRREQITC
jgi:putative DNA primase/helicase